MKLKLLLFLLVATVFVSCRATKEERARRLIEKAERLYPISSLVAGTIRIDTLVKYDTLVTTKIDSIPFEVLVEKPTDGRFKPYKDKKVYDSDKGTVYASLTEKGLLTFTVVLKPKIIRVQGEIRYKDSIAYKTKLIKSPPEKIKQKGFFYYSGISFWILVILGIIYLIIAKYETFSFKR